MRAPADMPPVRPRRSMKARVVLSVLLGALFLLLVSLREIAIFWTDYLWFDSLGLAEVFSGVIRSQVMLAVAFALVFFLLLWVNLVIADRVAPAFRPMGAEEELLERYHDVIDRRAGLVRAGTALLFGVMFGVGAASQWRAWILFNNRQEFGVTDPLFHKDVGFYVFQIPFLTYVVDWLFVSMVIITIVTAIAHYLNGGIRVQSPLQRVTPQVKAHLSVLMAVIALVKLADYWLQQYELLFSTRGVIDGAGFTAVNASLPAIKLLMLISIAACILFIVNIWLRGWVLPITAVGLWAFAALIVGTAYPSFVQRFKVEPEESAQESEYIERNIEATRLAMGLDDVETVDLPYDENLTAEDFRDYADTLRNVRLLDPVVLRDTYERLEAQRGFYRFADLDVDRYMLDRDGEPELTQVVVGSRELSPGSVPQKSWEGQHVAYTHGYGVAFAPANEVTDNGRPNFALSGVPTQISPQLESLMREVTTPQLYHGDGLTGYAIVGTERDEIDYVADDSTTQKGRYDGSGGVPVSGDGVMSFVRRAAFALRLGEVEPFISNFITDESRMIYVRDVRERVEKAAPFFSYDSDPYPVVLDGAVYYVLDGYSTSDHFPYGQTADTEQLPAGSGLRHRYNYVRNSVKAVVDAYNGDVTLYVVDPDDPITAAYRQAFPDLFADLDEMPEGLEQHLRYPEDLFRVQTNMWARYQLSDPGEWYVESAGWEVSQDPGRSVAGPEVSTVTSEDGTVQTTRESRINPVYQLLQLPNFGDEEEPMTEAQVVLTRPFVPRSQEDELKLLSAFMTAGSDWDHYGELRVYRMPGTDVDGPAIVNANISNDETIAREISLLDQRGSQVLYGEMLLVPIADSIIYVRPLYVQAQGETAVPELKNVIVVYGEHVEMGESFLDAMTKIFDGEEEVAALTEILSGLTTGPSPDDGEPTEPTEPDEPSVERTLEELLAEAAGLFEEADAALAEEDLVTYAEKITEARAVFDEALGLLESGTGDGSGGDAQEPGQGDGDGAGGGDADDGGGSSTTTTTAQDPDEVSLSVG